MHRKTQRLRHAARATARGFTLIEVLIALALMAVGVTALIAMSTFSLRNESAAGELIRSKSVAEERIAILATAPTGQLGDGTATDTRCQQPVVESGVTIHTVDCTYVAAGARIDVAVEVSHPLMSNPVRLETSRYVP